MGRGCEETNGEELMEWYSVWVDGLVDVYANDPEEAAVQGREKLSGLLEDATAKEVYDEDGEVVWYG